MGRFPKIELIPNGTKILGIDIGKRKWGIALSDERKRVAFPYGIVSTQGKTSPEETIRQLVQKERVELMVCGLPYHMHGGKGTQEERIRTQMARISEITGIPHVFIDERLSTEEAKEKLLMTAKDNLPLEQEDDKAAQVILQRYLDQEKDPTIL